MKRKHLIISILVLPLMLIAGVWVTGSILTSPARKSLGDAPSDLAASAVQFQSDSGATIKGWFIRGRKGAGAIVLMHGLRSNRLSLVDRARFISRAGFSVLLFDFQSHGESSGDRITFGYLESRDAQAAVEFLRANAPDERIGVLGISMGGASTLLASPSLDVNAMVLEMVYPTITQAVSNRLSVKLGRWARICTPLLTSQLRPRLGVSAEAMRPIEKVGGITIPKLFIVGAADQYTTLEESQQMFNVAAEPKELWTVERATHTDIYPGRKEEYEQRVLSFFNRQLTQSSK